MDVEKLIQRATEHYWDIDEMEAFLMVAGGLRKLAAENAQLKDRVWEAERRYHLLDEWEKEPEDG